MLRVHCVQMFHNLSEPSMEALFHAVESVCRFVGLRLTGALPDGTTIPNFRHLLDKHAPGEAPFEQIDAHPASPGHRLKTGTIVDESIVAAPSSTVHRGGERDPHEPCARRHAGEEVRVGPRRDLDTPLLETRIRCFACPTVPGRVTHRPDNPDIRRDSRRNPVLLGPSPGH